MATKSETPLYDKLKKSKIPKVMHRLMRHTGTANADKMIRHFDEDEAREGQLKSQMDEEPAPLNQEQTIKTPNSIIHKMISRKKKPDEVSETVIEKGVSATPLSDRLAKSGIGERMSRLIGREVNADALLGKEPRELLKAKLKKKKQPDFASMEKIDMDDLNKSFSRLMNK